MTFTAHEVNSEGHTRKNTKTHSQKSESLSMSNITVAIILYQERFGENGAEKEKERKKGRQTEENKK